MVCIYCRASTQVRNSRPQKRLNQVWRRRQCLVCDSTFTTHERVDLGGSIRVRYDTGELSPFNKDALLISIYESCRHRPTAASDASALTETVIASLANEISRSLLEREAIISAVLKVLKRFDKPAATMYEAYHPRLRGVAK